MDSRRPLRHSLQHPLLFDFWFDLRFLDRNPQMQSERHRLSPYYLRRRRRRLLHDDGG